MQTELFPQITPDKQQIAEDQIISEQQVVDYQIREYPIDVIVDKFNEGRGAGTNEIFIPEYQRKFVWDQKKQSKFIESLMLDLPIPYIFAADNDGRMEIVDGSQRVRTLEAFLTNKLQLINLTKLNELNEFRHKDLSVSRQRRFNRKTIRIIELTDKANRDVRKDIFERINTTPTVLKAMEVRKGVYEGEFYQFIKEFSSNSKYKLLCPISEVREKREEREEMTLRFFAYSDNYLDFDHVVEEFVSDYIKIKQYDFDAERMAKEFEDMLDFADIYFPYGFRKSFNARSTPRVRFEALAVGINLALRIKPELSPKHVEEWLNSADFKRHTRSDGSNSRIKVKERIEFVRDKLLHHD